MTTLRAIEPLATGFESPFEAWRLAQLRCPDRRARLAPATDRAFWSRVAADYDERSSLARQAPRVVERVLELVGRPATLLDIGAGSGGFSLPLAERSGRLTALDHSPDMLEVFERRLVSSSVLNVRIVLADAEKADLGQHEVVFSANALYRTLDLRRWLERAHRAAERLVLLVLGVGRQPAYPPCLHQVLGPERLAEGANLPELLPGLKALGIRPAVELIEVERSSRYADAEACLAALTRAIALSDGERAACLAGLESVLEDDPAGRVYRCRQRVALVCWKPAP